VKKRRHVVKRTIARKGSLDSAIQSLPLNEFIRAMSGDSSPPQEEGGKSVSRPAARLSRLRKIRSMSDQLMGTQQSSQPQEPAIVQSSPLSPQSPQSIGEVSNVASESAASVGVENPDKKPKGRAKSAGPKRKSVTASATLRKAMTAAAITSLDGINEQAQDSEHCASPGKPRSLSSWSEIHIGRNRFGVMVHRIIPVKEHCLVLSKGSIVDFSGDAVVNAANSSGMSGAGLDGALVRAGGKSIEEARLALPQVRPGVRIPTGQARVTHAGDLQATWVIHAVGPIFRTREAKGDKWPSMDAKLRQAYTSSMERALEHECHSVGFALLSAGTFRGERSLDVILSTGIEALISFLSGLVTPSLEVHMVAYSVQELCALNNAANRAGSLDC
jgi:O-acetyl-ADP-ribose deacetylase (regulator of RNase III)